MLPNRYRYKHIKDEEVFNLYYANEGDYDWRKKTGTPGPWKHTLGYIAQQFGFKTIASVADRVTKYKLTPRAKLSGEVGSAGAWAGRAPRNGRLPSAATPRVDRMMMARSVVNAHIFHTAVMSPRVGEIFHEVAQNLARTMGYEAPSKPDSFKYIHRLAAKMAKSLQ